MIQWFENLDMVLDWYSAKETNGNKFIALQGRVMKIRTRFIYPSKMSYQTH